jgi:hypothetical protein
MKVSANVGCFIVAMQAVTLWAAESRADGNRESPKFAVYASETDAELGSSLFRVLRRKGQRARFDRVETIKQAIESEADVLVLVLPGRELPKLEKATLESLKKRKIVGIGYGAAQLFGQLGLEINGGACMHGVARPPSLLISKSELLGEPKKAEPILVLQETAKAAPDADFFAVFLPPRGPNASVADVIARWRFDPNYAPVVRQGNCVLIGIPTPATEWTTAYADLIREICLALQARKVEAFSTARREVTKPGTYEFKLAQRGSTDLPFSKTYYFQFTQGKRFHAQLEHSGSNSVMLIFMGQDENRTHWTRQDARQGQTLQIKANITQEDIKKLDGRYWTLSVTNFGANTGAACKLTITIEEP